MPSLINDHVLATTEHYRQAFSTAKPFKHVVIDDFLKSDFAESLLVKFPTVSDPTKLVSEFGTPNPKSARSDVRGLAKPFVQIDAYIQSVDFLNLMSNITGIADLCYDPWYYGAGTHENFHGAGLDAHYDFNIHPQTAYHRRLNAIIYLNKDWNPDWRGEISFHTDPWDLDGDVITSVHPSFNRCVIFETTENSWHSVGVVNLPKALRHLSRKSFTIYLYTKTRPENEIAVEHGTVYVPPPLPSCIGEGRTLNADDMADINTNIHRRHQFLKIMYQKEYRLLSEIQSLKQQLFMQNQTYTKITGSLLYRAIIKALKLIRRFFPLKIGRQHNFP